MNPDFKEYSFAKYFFLSLLTFGIYGIYVLYKVGDACNVLCATDGKKSMNYIGVFFLAPLTFGIVPLVWNYRVIERYRFNAGRYNAAASATGSSYLALILVPYTISLIAGSVFGLLFIPFLPIIESVVFVVIIVCSLFAQSKILSNYNAYVYALTSNINNVPNNVAVNNMNNYYGMNSYNPVNQNRAVTNNQQNMAYRAPVSNNQQNMAYRAPVSNNVLNNSNVVPETTGKTAQQKRGFVKCISGEFQGAVFPLRGDDQIIIGRNPSAGVNLILNDTYVSGQHVIIKLESVLGAYRVTDLSTNGTFLDSGMKLEKNKPTTLNAGTILKLSNTNVFLLGEVSVN